MAVYRVGSNKSSVNNFPVIRPTLDLDFANSKTLDSRITFTRASGGSYVGADGLIKYAGVNEERFDHDPATGESLGLLIEESRQNLLTSSEDFSFYLSINSSIIPNTDISPTGTSNATKLIENTTNLPHYIVVPVGTITPGKYYTFSCFAKSNNPDRLFSLIFSTSSLFGGVFPRASFDLTTGKVHTVISATSAEIHNYGNGWYRCSVTVTPSTQGSADVQLRMQTQDTASSMIGPYTGDGVSNIFIWGAQAEEGTFPTSYIPTQGSTRTRAADNAVITGKNFSEWYRQDEGTICIESTNLSVYGGSNIFPYLAQIDNGTNNNRISFDFSVLSDGYRYNFVVTSNGVTLAEIGPAGSSKNSAKWVAGIKSNDFITTTSASPEITYKSSNETPKNTMNRLQLGAGFGARFTGTIKKLTYYPKRLPNSQLQALTR